MGATRAQQQYTALPAGAPGLDDAVCAAVAAELPLLLLGKAQASSSALFNWGRLYTHLQ
jgi:hypothetical protein